MITAWELKTELLNLSVTCWLLSSFMYFTIKKKDFVHISRKKVSRFRFHVLFFNYSWLLFVWEELLQRYKQVMRCSISVYGFIYQQQFFFLLFFLVHLMNYFEFRLKSVDEMPKTKTVISQKKATILKFCSNLSKLCVNLFKISSILFY